jgi:Domain of unknown function (DUF4159)
MKQLRWTTGLLAAGAIAAAITAAGDNLSGGAAWPSSEMQFARLFYSERRGYGYGGGSWRVDYPEAEIHFTEGVSRLTRVDIRGNGVILRLTDDTVFDYPWLYAVEVGYWDLSDYEAQRLREYLLRGGFLMVDDFHGTREWTGFMESLKRVFPDRPVVEIREEDEVMHVLYDLEQNIQIPGIRALYMGQTYEYDGYMQHWRGIYDDAGRLMVAINFNMDLGDAWEHADDPQYPNPMTALAYRFAVNYVVYAMTH